VFQSNNLIRTVSLSRQIATAGKDAWISLPAAFSGYSAAQLEDQEADMDSEAVGDVHLFVGDAVLLFGLWRNHLRRHCWAAEHWFNGWRARTFKTGCLHALSSQWSVHHGRLGFELSLHDRRLGLCDSWQDAESAHAATQSHSAHLDWLYLHHRVFHNHLDLYANEVAWLPYVIQQIGFESKNFGEKKVSLWSFLFRGDSHVYFVYLCFL